MERTFWQTHRRKLMVLAVPAWVVFITALYSATRPKDQSSAAVNTLTIGALPVT